MCAKHTLPSVKDIVGYTMPRLHKASTWYVDFYAYDPERHALRRKKYMLGHCSSDSEREDIAAVLIHNIYHKLLSGWNPFVNDRRSRELADFGTVIQRYREYIATSADKGVIKQKTGTDYLSRLKQLELYILENNIRITSVHQFDAAFVVDFLDYLILDNGCSARTRNNYRTWISTLCTWLVGRKYIPRNFIDDIPLVKAGEKKRDPLTEQDLARLSRYTSEHCPAFHLACLMEYYTFIRPGELRYIKIGDISVKEQSVFVSPEVSKNRKGQHVALNDKVIKTMLDQGVFNYPSSHYLFGNNLVPGGEPLYVNRLRREWEKVRKALRFPDSYQFYSLKDSGIRDLANTEGIVVARDQARHSDISTTNKYLKSASALHDGTKHFDGSL